MNYYPVRFYFHSARSLCRAKYISQFEKNFNLDHWVHTHMGVRSSKVVEEGDPVNALLMAESLVLVV